MKFAKYTSDKEYSFLILENYSDLEMWANLNTQIRAKQAINFWMGFKSQTFRQTPVDYCAHEDNQNMMGVILGTKMTFTPEPTSLVKYCTNSDDIIHQMHTYALKYIRTGKLVRINTMGGMCPIDDLDEYTTIKEINELGLLNFMLHKDPDYIMDITGKTVVLENVEHTPEKLMKELTTTFKIPNTEIQFIGNFKQRTILYKEMDFYILFKNAIENGLRNISFDTSAQDMKQITGLKTILEKIMSQQEFVLNIYVSCANWLKEKLTTNSENIKIIFTR